MRVSFHSVFRYSGNGSRFPGERVEEIIPDASCDVSEYFLKEISFPFNQWIPHFRTGNFRKESKFSIAVVEIPHSRSFLVTLVK